MIRQKPVLCYLFYTFFFLNIVFVSYSQSNDIEVITNKIDEARKSGKLEKLPILYQKLSKTFAEKEDYEQALINYERYKLYQDSISQENISKLEQKIDKLSSKPHKSYNSNILNYVIGIGIFFIVIFFIYLYVSNQQRKILNNKLKSKNTEINSQKEEIQTQNEQLLKLDEEKNDAMRSVAHDLKAPLNRVSGLSELIFIEKERLSDEQYKYLSLIKQVAEDSRKMIQNWLDIKAIEAQSWEINWEDIRPKQIVEDLLQGYKEHIERKSIKIRLVNKSNTEKIRSDANFLNRILDNLISNAVKFSSKHKNIYITITEDSQNLIISVKDEGQGMSEEDKMKLFQKFQKLSAKPTAGESSSGLGLSIVKMLLDRLGSEIDVESKLGDGANFIIKLPKK